MNTSRAMPVNSTDNGRVGEMGTHWRIVAAAFAGLIPVNFFHFSLGVFISPLHETFGWSRSTITFAMVIGSGIQVVAFPLVGIAVDRFGSRRIGILGLMVFGLAIAGLALSVPNVWSWWLGVSLVCAAQVACAMMVWTAGITSCFDKRRGLALGIALAGAGVSGFISPSIANGLIAAWGWRFAFVGLGALVWLIALPLVWPWYRPPVSQRIRHTQRGNFLRSTILTLTFWQIAIAIVLLTASLLGLMIHFVPFMESVGISRTTGAVVAGLVGLVSTFGRPVAGALLDRFELQHVGACMFGLPIVAAALFLLAPTSMPALTIAAFALGLSLGGENNIIAYVTGGYSFLRENYGASLGMLAAILAIGGGVGPALGSAIFDRTGEYKLLFFAVIVMCAVSALLILTLRSPSTRVD